MAYSRIRFEIQNSATMTLVQTDIVPTSTRSAIRKPERPRDFLIREGKKIVPIEVKSSGSSSIKSLVRFKEKFGKRIGEAIVLHHGEIKQQDDVWYLPYYMATLL